MPSLLGSVGEGDVVRVSPHWVPRVFWALVALVAVTIGMLFVAEVDQYTKGPAIVRMRGKVDVTAHESGTLAKLMVARGDRVAKGDVLAQLDATEARTSYDRQYEAFATLVSRRLLDPSDEVVASALVAARSALAVAEDTLDQREIRAPREGTISDLRLRPGQTVHAGDVVLSMAGAQVGHEVIAVVPGGDRPMLAPGQTLRLELVGYRYAYQDLTITSIDDGVIGPAAVKQFLGPTVADALPISGPSVLVRARLDTPDFEADDRTYLFYDGMPALAEIRTRSESVAQTLFPALKRLR